jgi:5-methylcytosine-specific restriction endonuclease McrBC GTP-binding regulatory subunit McrB
MYQYNYRALKTLKAMNLTKQATKSIRGQLLGMSEAEAAEYIRKIERRNNGQIPSRGSAGFSQRV